MSFEGDSVTIGRSSTCVITLRESHISRTHCILEVGSDGKWTVTDLDSTHGMKVNGSRVKSAQLAFGDELKIGPYTLTFGEGAGPEEDASHHHEDDADESGLDLAASGSFVGFADTGLHGNVAASSSRPAMQSPTERGRSESRDDAAALRTQINLLTLEHKTAAQRAEAAEAKLDEIARSEREASQRAEQADAEVAQMVLKLDKARHTALSKIEECDRLTAQLASLKKEMAARLKAQQVEADVAETVTSDSEHIERITELETALKDARDQQAQSDQRIAKLDAELKEVTDALKAARLEESQASVVDIDEAGLALLREQHAASLQKVDELETELCDVAAQLEEAKQAPSPPPGPALDIDAEQLAELRKRAASIDEWVDEVEQLQTTVTHLEERAAAAEKDAQDRTDQYEKSLAESQSTVDTLRQQIESLETSLTAAQQRTEQLETEQLEAERTGNEALSSRIEELEASLATAQAQHVAESEEIATLTKQALADSESLEALRRSLDEESRSRLAAVEELDATVQHLEGAEEKITELQTRFTALEAEKQSAQEHGTRAERKTTEATARIESLEAGLSEQKLAVAEAMRERDRARDRIAGVISELDQLRTMNAELAKVEQTRNARVSELEAQLRTIETERDAASALATKHAAALATIRGELAALNEARESLAASHEESLKAITQQRDALKDELERAQAMLDAVDEDSIVAATGPHPGRGAQNDSGPASLADLADRITQLEAELSATREQHQRAEHQARLARNNQAEFKRRVSEVEEDRGKLITRYKTAMVKLESAQRELTAARNRSRDYESLLAQYLNSEGDFDAVVVEMTPEEIARAQAEGATVVELNTVKGTR
ncbi:MAG: FHA domain-containing protein [Phycisphaerales bacterium]